MIGNLLVRCRCKNSNKICPGPACQDTIHFTTPFKVNSKYPLAVKTLKAWAQLLLYMCSIRVEVLKIFVSIEVNLAQPEECHQESPGTN